jgi:hypothetical protein
MYDIVIALAGGLACAVLASRTRPFATCPACQIAVICVARLAATRRYSCARCQREFLRLGDGALVSEADWDAGARGDLPVARALR